jgi:hypothetical protein
MARPAELRAALLVADAVRQPEVADIVAPARGVLDDVVQGGLLRVERRQPVQDRLPADVAWMR